MLRVKIANKTFRFSKYGIGLMCAKINKPTAIWECVVAKNKVPNDDNIFRASFRDVFLGQGFLEKDSNFLARLSLRMEDLFGGWPSDLRLLDILESILLCFENDLIPVKKNKIFDIEVEHKNKVLTLNGVPIMKDGKLIVPCQVKILVGRMSRIFYMAGKEIPLEKNIKKK